MFVLNSMNSLIIIIIIVMYESNAITTIIYSNEFDRFDTILKCYKQMNLILYCDQKYITLLSKFH